MINKPLMGKAVSNLFQRYGEYVFTVTTVAGPKR